MPQEQLDFAVGGRHAGATLWLPETEAGAEPLPAVLICPQPPAAVHDFTALVAELRTALNDAGLAAASLNPPANPPQADATITDCVDDASAAFRQLLLHDKIEGDRVGVFGVELGALIAAALAGRTDRIARLCLLGPVTNTEVLSRIAKPDSSAALLDGGAVSESLVDTLGTLTPLKEVATHQRPTLIIHAAADKIVALPHVEPYLEALAGGASPTRFELVARADHTFSDLDIRTACLARIGSFFSETIATPLPDRRAET